MNSKRVLRTVLAGMMWAMFFDVAWADGGSSITVDSVVQRWPWNNKIDITYTVSGGQNISAGVYAKIVFTATIGGKAYTIDGMSDVAAIASDGTHTVTYMLPVGLRAKNCTMTAKLIATEVPSGDDYMIVDLVTGAIAWEGLMVSQDASNDRYNTDVYKTSKLALRKVSAGSHYAAGKNWTTDKAYYVGIFPVTKAQYAKICGGSGDTKPKDESWNNLRVKGTAPGMEIPSVSSDTGTFFQRLNFKTKRYFDLPTELMHEIAQRAGSSTVYYWGDEMDLAYLVCKETEGTQIAVGMKEPNDWGLYDMAGNVWEWCLDVVGSYKDLSSAPDPFTPGGGMETGFARYTRGGSAGDSSSGDAFKSSYRFGENYPGSLAPWIGFRAYTVVK